MKRFILILTAALLAATTAHGVTWLRTYDGEKWLVGTCIQQTSDSNYVVTGATRGDNWYLKIDTLGSIIWEREDGGGNWIEQTSDGGYILAGTPDLCKTNEWGDTIWTRDFNIYSHCAIETSDGGYILAGTVIGPPKIATLIKTNNDGDSLWSKTYLEENWVFSSGRFVRQTQDDGYIVSGIITDTTFENGRSAFWLLKTDSLGNIQWSHIQGGENWGDSDQGLCAHEINDSTYIALANFGLLKFNQFGDTLWSRGYRNANYVQETLDSGYVLTGDGDYVLAAVQSANKAVSAWLKKTNINGDSLWEQTYGPGALLCLTQTHDKGFIMTGQKDVALVILKTDSLGLLGVTEEPVLVADRGWEVGSHIGRRIAIFYEDLPQGLHVKVYNVAGQQVDEIYATGRSGFVTWGIGHLPGVYFISAPDKHNQTITAKVVVIH